MSYVYSHQLSYVYDALEPVISARTLEIHHGKHLQDYVDNLNKLIAGTDLENKSLEEIVILGEAEKSKSIFNIASQILNHNFYFTQFAPRSVGEPVEPLTGPLKAENEKQFGSFDALNAEFEAKSANLFGCGWVWLSADKGGILVITQEPSASNPIIYVIPDPYPGRLVCLSTYALESYLTFDVWKHAYFLDYQNRRAACLK